LVLAGIAAGVAFVLSCSSGPMVFGQPIDMAMMNGNCGTCTRMVTADTDLAQLSSGTVPSPGASTLVVTGPFVLTDVVPAPQGQATLTLGPGTSCPLTGATTWLLQLSNLNGVENIHGARLPVPSGSVVCGTATNGPMLWSGFKPY
jgi:hypothetical protein